MKRLGWEEFGVERTRGRRVGDALATVGIRALVNGDQPPRPAEKSRGRLAPPIRTSLLADGLFAFGIE